MFSYFNNNRTDIVVNNTPLRMYVRVINSLGIISAPSPPIIAYYQPILTYIVPSSLPAFGGDMIRFYGSGLNVGWKNDDILFMMGGIPQTQFCTNVNNTFIECKQPTHSEGTVKLSISFNS
ncbi:hypothetical protein AKO1_003233, partial [Acrasis kona]